MPVCTIGRGRFHLAAGWAGTGIGSERQCFEVGAQVLGQAHHDVEAAIALEDQPGLLAADRDLDRPPAARRG